MKKHLLVFVSILVSAVAIAQGTPSLGIRGGLSSAHLQGEAMNSLGNLLNFTNGRITTSARTGYFAGVYATIPLTEVLSLEPALYYAQKGYALHGALNLKGVEFMNVTAKAQLNAQYIDFPVVIKASMGGWQLFAGPQVSYLAQAGLHTTAGLLGINVLKSNLDATNQFNRWDAGITGGAGYRFANGLNITAAYDLGLLKADAGKTLNAYNRSVKIGVGFSF